MTQWDMQNKRRVELIDRQIAAQAEAFEREGGFA
jgi:four helix bundle suffix protein